MKTSKLYCLFVCTIILTIAACNSPAPQSTLTLSQSTTNTSASELVITGQLIHISSPPQCGYFYFGAIAEYSNITVISGNLPSDKVFVIHACPEIERKSKRQETSFYLKTGGFYELHLTLTNAENIQNIYFGEIELPNKLPQKCEGENISLSGKISEICTAEELVKSQEGRLFFTSEVDLADK